MTNTPRAARHAASGDPSFPNPITDAFIINDLAGSGSRVDSTRLGGQAQVPAEVPLHPAVQTWRSPAPWPVFHILILDVFGDAVGKNVVDERVRHVESRMLDQRAALAERVGISYRASGLRFGMFGDQFFQLPELALAVSHQNPKHFP